MSDTEDSFDKEAEREKLREQLREEEENRRSTQHMSELLLKGATMTNKHCDTCGDPLFRYEGQEFCPTCARDGSGEGQGGTATAGAEAGRASTATDEAGARAKEAPGIDRVATDTGDEAPTVPGASAAGAETATRAGADVPEDIAAARAALVRKLSSLAHEAEATDDVGRSRELLAAAREAAEALAAIDAVRG